MDIWKEKSDTVYRMSISQKSVWNSLIKQPIGLLGLVGLAGLGPFQGLDSLAIHDFWAVSGSHSLVQKVSYSKN